MMELLGSWQAVEDIPVRMNNKEFTLPRGAIAAVVQVDEDNQKVLLEMGPMDVDWFCRTVLNNFEKLD